MTASGPLRLVHHHPGRVRARASVFVDVGEEHPAVAAARAAAALAPIRSFHHFPVTGSILIEYAPGSVDPDELLERIAASAGCSGVVHDTEDKDHRGEFVDTVIDAVRSLNELAYEVTGRRADLRELVPCVLVGWSAYALFTDGGGTGHKPRWEVAFWFAQTAFTQWHATEIARKSAEESAR